VVRGDGCVLTNWLCKDCISNVGRVVDVGTQLQVGPFEMLHMLSHRACEGMLVGEHGLWWVCCCGWAALLCLLGSHSWDSVRLLAETY
jgi:hypothetical protein